jgi:hypothetical protein
MQPSDHNLPSGAILAAAEAADEPLEAWTPEEFDHFTDLGLVRSFND